jgi:RNA polymerase sigma-70 factor (ECF subfamily)
MVGLRNLSARGGHSVIVTRSRRGADHRVDEKVVLGPAEWRHRERFERMFREEYDAVLAYAVMRADLELAKDAAAQTFLVAWRRRDELPDPPRAWLFGVTRRTLADLRRSRSRQEALRSRLSDAEESAGNDVEETSEIAPDRDIVGVALDRLQDRDAELLKLIYWDGFSCREAAESFGCSITAVKVRLHRARRRFQVEVEQLDNSVHGFSAQRPARTASPHDAPVPNSTEV